MTRSQESVSLSQELKKSTVSLPADLYWQFQEEQGRRRLSNQAAVIQAIQQWVDRRTESTPSQERLPENEHWHSVLAKILASGDRDAISAVQQNLLVFERLMRPVITPPDDTQPLAG